DHEARSGRQVHGRQDGRRQGDDDLLERPDKALGRSAQGRRDGSLQVVRQGRQGLGDVGVRRHQAAEEPELTRVRWSRGGGAGPPPFFSSTGVQAFLSPASVATATVASLSKGGIVKGTGWRLAAAALGALLIGSLPARAGNDDRPGNESDKTMV